MSQNVISVIVTSKILLFYTWQTAKRLSFELQFAALLVIKVLVTIKVSLL